MEAFNKSCQIDHRLPDLYDFTTFSSLHHHSITIANLQEALVNTKVMNSSLGAAAKKRGPRIESINQNRLSESYFLQETSMLMRVWLEKLRENIIHSLSTYFNQQGSRVSAFIFLSFLPVTLSKPCCCNCATCVVRSFHFMFFLLILKTYKTTQLGLARQVFER